MSSEDVVQSQLSNTICKDKMNTFFPVEDYLEKERIVIVSPDYIEVLGTDRFGDTNSKLGKEFLEYRKNWKAYPEKKFVAEFPLHLDIECTNTCNLRCLMCQIPFNKMNPGFMKIGLLDKILNEIRENNFSLPSVKFNFRGEPLMHPRIADLVKKSKEAGVLEVQFNTNGALLQEELIYNLINAGLVRIKFSVDAVIPEIYNAIRKGANFEETISKILKFIEIRNKLDKDFPIIQVQMVYMASTHKYVKDYIKFWEDKVNRIGFSRYRSDHNIIDEAGKIKELSKKRIPCHQLWQRLVITWDGIVLMCCGDHQLKNPVGNLQNQTLSEIWKGEKMNKMRSLHSKFQFDSIEACKECQVNYL